ncbi:MULTISPECIES: 3-deoxy-manno-octulosonate cytidylyltransferase [unclassified Salinivibrio]|uniref:3-deoxy-manno-octulosonate cytidylyltransferase n=1 Tax=unclassified Salinivibrio TaxID=2636825 RepID=UPI00084C3857|nr:MULTISPECIES: 3-deoxy-manno-octulosonate cytidylyltransferase [unclassified Salinivibrio]ODQ01072.1 3-deoxy-manno-octulosonate cytidylyltransferase [Salinivibrio sp. DV]OOF10151.1 3-deoxy-manno-octulosonate cytidylyltransferase [Salinivibrio sp. PR5]OOF12308.1 3-deoxy-manno-octulosonate cytidylyltransferase [Salinivibrio sp. PR919]OOF16301.1 3-deoxy-manno-octulosonate cytidylyltransferase [Salinivibrio sp. PR932]
MTDFYVVIPARYGSSRLPGKPLADIGGKPMIQHVYERAQAAGAKQVIVATDDARIVSAVEAFGGEVCLTRDDHQSGTERLAEVVTTYGFADDAIIVNVQGDEPLIPSAVIRQVADNLNTYQQAPMATLAVAIDQPEQVFNPNVVKVVTDHQGFALYFSRATIPWDREHFGEDSPQVPESLLRHIGIYGYRAGFISQYIHWTPSPLEKIESLEQLRVLWHGEKIHVDVARETPPHGVDTQADLEAVRAHLAS